MYWRNLFFSFDGRIRRRDYWIAMAILFAIAAIPLPIYAYGFAIPIEDRPLYNLPLAVILAYPSMAVLTKRLHDRNKSWWWAAPYYPVFFVDLMIVRFIDESMFRLILEAPLIIYLIWIFIECGFFRGTVGPNPYGADPRPQARRTAAGA